MSSNEEISRRKRRGDPETTDFPFDEDRVDREPETFESSSDDVPYEMDAETRAAFERAMERHHEEIKRLAKL